MKAPGRAGQGRRVKLNCESCFFGSRNFQIRQALCRLIFLQALIGPDFEPDLSLRLDAALKDLEDIKARRRGGQVIYVGEFSARQGAFHIQHLFKALERNLERALRKDKNDWIPIAFGGLEDVGRVVDLVREAQARLIGCRGLVLWCRLS